MYIFKTLINKNNNMENYNNSNDINESNPTNLYWLCEKYENINKCILKILE